MSLRDLTVPELLDEARSGDRRAIGRLLTLVERGGEAADQVAKLTHPDAGKAHVVGITGAPGAGKSTLTGRLAAGLAATGHRVAVVAIDPSSPLNGGAILGDRIRMDEPIHATEGADPNNVFIRSMATRGQSGGLAVAVPGAVRLFDALGFDPVIVETVGVGQIEVDITAASDTTVVVVTPGWGDAVQANKAGLLEVADIFVVNKAERPGASDARRDLELMLDLGGHPAWRPPILMTTAVDNVGIDEVSTAISTHLGHLRESGEIDTRRGVRARSEVATRLHAFLLTRVDETMATTEGEQVLADVDDGTVAPVEAAHRLSNYI